MELASVFKFFNSSKASTVVASILLVYGEVRYLALLRVVSSVDPPCGQREKGYCLTIWGKRKDLIKLRKEER